MASSSIKLTCPMCSQIARVTSKDARLICWYCHYEMVNDDRMRDIIFHKRSAFEVKLIEAEEEV